MDEKVTDWFDGGINPVHEGEYEVDRKGTARGYPARTRLLWNGREWLHASHSAPRYTGWHASMRGDKWRGLASDPKASKP
jgi:hypothetical protein